jgi:asparagine synthase (glutamine-hydrolysing)
VCGIAGVIDLVGQADIDPHMLTRMADAIYHRGPDEDGYLHRPGIGMANRRLSIVGLADGRQPIFNEDGSIAVVFNGELFDYIEKKAELEALGHRFRTHCDTEVLVHMWEQYGTDMLLRLRGQFAFAIYDANRREIILARDRLGICPLHWARRGDRLYFGSEIKAILASGEVEAEVDPRGLDHIFTFFAMPSRRTAFKNIQAIYPGHFLRIQLHDGSRADVEEHQYFDLDFPDRGEEENPRDPQKLFDEFEERFRHAVNIRLRADVPVVSYLSGGVDSTSVLATAGRVLGSPIPSFTIRIPTKKLDETERAKLAAETVNSPQTIVTTDSETIAKAYPQLVEAAESPVMDTSCAALYCLAREVRNQGYKVALTGEGADEALAGYPWFKGNRLLNAMNFRWWHLGDQLRDFYHGLNSKDAIADHKRVRQYLGSSPAQVDVYGFILTTRHMFYRRDWLEKMDGHLAYDDLEINFDRMKRWHPLNQSLYLGYKTMLPGLLMNHKGDRPAMHNSLETRYPFLDEDFTEFCTRVHPDWKLRGLNKDKYLLRQYARRILPKTITDRPKAMFRAPFANTFFENPPAYVEQLLSREALEKTGYFDVERVWNYRNTYARYSDLAGRKLCIEMGLAGVMATQLWHHIFLGGGLCDLPTWDPAHSSAVAAGGR